MFIVFEGLDGSGKSSLMQRLSSLLLQERKKVLQTREPGGSALGDEIRTLLLRKEGDTPVPRAELLLYEASRAQHVDRTILPALRRGEWVLCDRFTASSIAFQCGGRDIAEKDVQWLNDFASSGLKPDLTVLIDLSVGTARARMKKREEGTGQQADRFESEADAFHERIRASYLEQSRQDISWIVLDGRQTPEELFRRLMEELEEREWLKPHSQKHS